MPIAVTRPNFQSVSGVSTSCADAVMPIVQIIIEKIFFMVLFIDIEALKIVNNLHKKSHPYGWLLFGINSLIPS
jgi:hypothetical protein